MQDFSYREREKAGTCYEKIVSEWEEILFSSFDDSQRKEIKNSLGIMFENVS